MRRHKGENASSESIFESFKRFLGKTSEKGHESVSKKLRQWSFSWTSSCIFSRSLPEVFGEVFLQCLMTSQTPLLWVLIKKSNLGFREIVPFHETWWPRIQKFGRVLPKVSAPKLSNPQEAVCARGFSRAFFSWSKSAFKIFRTLEWFGFPSRLKGCAFDGIRPYQTARCCEETRQRYVSWWRLREILHNFLFAKKFDF